MSWLLILITSLMFDRPEENEDWKLTPEFKRGPLIRVGIIILYTLVLVIIYKDQDALINFRTIDG